MFLVSLLLLPFRLLPNTLALAVIVGGAYYIKKNASREHKGVDHLPGPSPKNSSWLYGHEYLVWTHEANELYCSWMKNFGSMFKINAGLGHDDIIIAGDHKAVHHIFNETYTYVKSPAFRPVIANIIGKGLIWAEGDRHRHQRKYTAQAFSQESIKNMSSVISDCAERLVSKYTNHILAHTSGKDGATVNIAEFTSCATLDVIGRVGFGYEFNSTALPLRSERLAKNSNIPLTDAEAMQDAWAKLVGDAHGFPAFFAPMVLRAVPSITKLPIPALHEQGEVKVIIRRLASRLLERERQLHAKDAASETKAGRDILSLLLRAQREHPTGDGMDDEELLDNIVTFVMVGHETSAGSINMTLLDLARNPEIQTRLREEIVNKGGDLSYSDINSLEYLDAVVKEGLRLHPGVTMTERVAGRDDVIPLASPIKGEDGQPLLTSLTVKKGQLIFVPFIAMNTLETTWGYDAKVFKPERWITPGGVPDPSKLPSGYAGTLSFLDGPRNCIGYRLAIYEFKVMLATLIRSLEFHDTGAVVRSIISPSLQPMVEGKAGALPMRVSLVEA